MPMTDKQTAAAANIRRVMAGERIRHVYDFDDEEMDEFMYRMLENQYIADLKILAEAFLESTKGNG